MPDMDNATFSQVRGQQALVVTVTDAPESECASLSHLEDGARIAQQRYSWQYPEQPVGCMMITVHYGMVLCTTYCYVSGCHVSYTALYWALPGNKQPS